MSISINKQKNNTFLQFVLPAFDFFRKTASITSFFVICIYGAATQAAVIATFDISSNLIDLPPNSALAISASSIGTASLDDTGTLTIVEATDWSYELIDIDGAYYQEVTETTFSGLLSGSIFTAVNMIERESLSCTDTGSTGDFAPDACVYLEPFDHFAVFTQPIEFDLTLDGITQFDWGYSYIAQGAPDPADGFFRVNLTTTSVSSVPVPPAFLLFLSGMFTLLTPKLTRLKNKAL